MKAPAEVRERIDGDLRSARRAMSNVGTDEVWALLECARVRPQPPARLPVKVHAARMVLGWHTGDWTEIAGQSLRLVVARPGWSSGRYPKGNTGCADVPAPQLMPAPEDLRLPLEADRG